MDFSKYKIDLPYPIEPVRAFRFGQNKGINPDYNTQLAEYKELKAEYDIVSNSLLAQFRSDAISRVGLTGHRKSDQAFALAMQRGQACGMSEVFNELQILAELLLD